MRITKFEKERKEAKRKKPEITIKITNLFKKAKSYVPKVVCGFTECFQSGSANNP